MTTKGAQKGRGENRGFSTKQRGKSGQWYAILDNGLKPDGKRDQKWVKLEPNPKDKKAADRMARALAVERDKGNLPKDEKTTLGSHLDQWLKTSTHLEETSYTTYESHIRKHIKPHIGHIPLTKLTYLDIREFYAKILRKSSDEKKKGLLSPSSVKDIHSILSKVLGEAYQGGLITRDPSANVSPPKVDKKAKKRVLSSDDATKLAESLAGTDLFVPIVLLAWTGLRRGEVLGLTWDKVDLSARRIYVEQALRRVTIADGVKESKLADPKNHSVRTIPIPEAIANLLESHRQQQSERRSSMGTILVNHNLVVPRSDGDYWVPNTFTKAVAYHAKRVGFPGITPHTMRHTHASILHRAGVSLKAIQERLGHSNAQTTLVIYTHTFEDAQEDATLRQEAVMKPPETANAKSPVH